MVTGEIFHSTSILKALRINNPRMVKHYSPSCPHCKMAAPIYQTLYEYYYVSKHHRYPNILDITLTQDRLPILCSIPHRRPKSLNPTSPLRDTTTSTSDL